MFYISVEKSSINNQVAQNVIFDILSKKDIVGGYDLGESEVVRYVFAVLNFNAPAIVNGLQKIADASAYAFKALHIAGVFVNISGTLRK